MIAINSWQEARILVTTFAMEQGQTVPEPIRVKLSEIFAMPSPVDQFCRTTELIYAHRGEVNAGARDLAASLAAFADRSAVGVYPGPGRYAALAEALQRDAQEGDPVAMPEYVTPS